MRPGRSMTLPSRRRTPHRPPFLFVTEVDRGRARRLGTRALGADRGRGVLRRPFPRASHPARRADGRVAGAARRDRRSARRALCRQAAPLRRDRAGPLPPPGRPRREARARGDHGPAVGPRRQGPRQGDGRRADRPARPICSSSSSTPGRRLMRLATWNVNSLTARLPRVTEWIEANQPDVLCMQETKQADDKFPREAFAALGYETAHHGDGRWNGVAIAQQGRARRRHAGLRHRRRRARAPHHLGRRAPAHGSSRSTCPTGGALDNEFYPVKLAWLARCAPRSTRPARPGPRSLSAATSTWRRTTATCGTRPRFVGATHVSEPERAALRARRGLGTRRRLPPLQRAGHLHVVGLPGGRFPQGRGMRIDLVLVSDDLAERATAAFRDRDARKGKKPSDHAPVVVDFSET